MTIAIESFAEGRWIRPGGEGAAIASAIDGRVVATLPGGTPDVAAMVAHARRTGGPALRALTFHDRADILRALAAHLNERKETLYALSAETGATRRDCGFDVDGGIGTLFAYASRGRRELPSERFVVEGPPETLAKGGGFVGQHVLVPLHGVAVHINAFNFPVWGPLEKFAPAFLAGMPVITKPATPTAYVTEALVRLIEQSGLLPPGALQMIAGPTGPLLDELGGQDLVAFTGSLETSERLRAHPSIGRHAVRFTAERDSLNAAILGPDAEPGTPEFDAFVREVVREMTTKAGQKCTAIRRAMVPAAFADAAAAAISAALAAVPVGDPRREDVRMGPLVGLPQRDDVRARLARLREEADLVFGDPDRVEARGADDRTGAFLSPILLRCDRPREATAVHALEAFGPVATLMAYGDMGEAVELVRRGEGSLVASLYTNDDAAAEEAVLGLAPFHGRLLVVDRDCAREQTGHGSPLPNLVHGGPGRAGGGEELGGLRAVFHHMQRTALQGSPRRMAALTRSWIKGAPSPRPEHHPFRLDFDALRIGDTIETAARTITLADIEHFAAFTGDTFYAHMDEAAAAANPFFPGRVAHGYLILSFAAGLFVDPAPGPVLANYGLDSLRFLKPVSPGDSIRVRLTAKAKNAARQPDYGEVRWDAEVFNQEDETVARYDLLTMNARA